MSVFNLKESIEEIKKKLESKTITIKEYMVLLQEISSIKDFVKTLTKDDFCCVERPTDAEQQYLENLLERMEKFAQLPIEIPYWVACSEIQSSPPSNPPEAPFSNREDYGYGINSNGICIESQILEQQRQENLRLFEQLNIQREKVRQAEIRRQQESEKREEELKQQELNTNERKKELRVLLKNSYQKRRELEHQKNARLADLNRQKEEESKKQEQIKIYQCSENLSYH